MSINKKRAFMHLPVLIITISAMTRVFNKRFRKLYLIASEIKKTVYN